MAPQEAGQGGQGDLRQDGADLGVSAAVAAQVEDLRFQFGGDAAGLLMRSGGAVIETLVDDQAEREAGPYPPAGSPESGLVAASGAGSFRRRRRWWR